MDVVIRIMHGGAEERPAEPVPLRNQRRRHNDRAARRQRRRQSGPETERDNKVFLRSAIIFSMRSSSSRLTSRESSK